MPIIPRYQPRGGPQTQTLDYAGAYAPPGGDDWRMLSRAAAAAGSVLDSLPRRTPATARLGARAEDHLLAQAEEVRWRRRQLEADEAPDAEGVRLSRQEMAGALPQGAREAFETLTAPREAGFAVAAAARGAAQVKAASDALSLERQAVGIDEYHALIETAPGQAMAALGSAIAELGARMSASGADRDSIAAAQRDLASEAQADRIERVLAADPARAESLVQNEPMLSEADRARLGADIALEHRRRQARDEVAALAAEHESLATEPEAFLRQAMAVGGEAPDLYAGAAIGEIRAAQARLAARDAKAWEPVGKLLDGGEVRSWTDIPAPVWGRLSEGHQAQVRARLDQDAPLAQEGALLARAGWTPRLAEGEPSLAMPFDPSDRQTWLSPQDRAVNLELAKIPAGDGLFVDPDTGQVVRHRLPRPDDLDGGGETEVVSQFEAQQFRERRLGVLSHRAGTMSQEEKDYRQRRFGKVDARPDRVIDMRRPIPPVFKPRGYRLEPDDETLLARIIFAEAGEIPEDYEALAWATLNRVNLDYRHSLFDVLVDPGQYDIVAEGGTGFDNELWLRSADPEKDIPPAKKADWERARRVARGVLSGQIADPTNGATLFFSDDDFDGTRETAPGGFRKEAMWNRVRPSPYRSRSKGPRKHYVFFGPMDRTRPNRKSRTRAEVMAARWVDRK